MSPRIEIRNADEPALSFGDMKRFMRFAWPRAVIGMAVTALLALIYLVTTPTQFTAVSSIIYDPVSSPSFVPNSTWLESNVETTTRIDSQVEVIKSERIGTRVVERLKLVEDPEFIDFAKIAGAKGGWSFTRLLAGKEAKADPEIALPAFLKRLSARRVGLTSIIEIGFTSTDAAKAVTIANTVARTFIEEALEQKSDAARNGTGWLQERLEQLRQLAFDAMLKAEQFKSSGAQSVDDSSVKLAELESIAQTYRRIYEIFLMRLTETSQRVNYPVADARIVSMAALPRVTRKPSAALVMAFALTLGAALGIAVSVARFALDSRLYSLAALVHAGIPCLGKVSLVRGAVEPPAKTSKAKRPDQEPPVPAPAGESAAELTGKAQQELWEIQLALLANRDLRLIGITSLAAGAGVTSLAVRFARNYASLGQRTLLIDFNLDDPAASRRFGGVDRPGLADVVAEKSSMTAAVLVNPGQGFSVLPAGTPALLPTTPGIFLTANPKRGGVRKLMENFDVCLLDLPPLAASSEARIIAPLLDAIILVAEHGVTPLPEVQQLIEQFNATNVALQGVILNKVPEA